MKIEDYDGKEVNWYILDVEHYNEEWLKWIIADLYEKLKQKEGEEKC